MYVPALWQGPLCPSNTQFPVVIFSHGLGGNRTTNTTVCCELASQGFIVASVEHRYEPPVIFYIEILNMILMHHCDVAVCKYTDRLIAHCAYGIWFKPEFNFLDK